MPETTNRSFASLQRRVLLAYAAPAFAQALIHGPTGAVLQGVYAKQFGLSLQSIALVLLVAGIADVVSNPLIGFASDRFRARFGSRKPWLISGSLLAALACWYLYAPTPPVTSIYFGAWLMIAYLAWATSEIPSGPASCLVYGQGLSGPDKPYFRHYQTRIEIRDHLRSLGVDAALPEELLDGSEADTLWAELELARTRDFVVAVQPPEPEKGPPTLKLELADLFWQDDLRCRVWVVYPLDRPDEIFTQYAERFDSRALGLPPGGVRALRGHPRSAHQCGANDPPGQGIRRMAAAMRPCRAPGAAAVNTTLRSPVPLGSTPPPSSRG